MTSLTIRLTIAFLVISLLGAVLALAYTRWATARQFDQFVVEQAQADFTSALTSYYQTYHSWDGMLDFANIVTNTSRLHNPPIPFGLADQNNRVIMSTAGYGKGDIVNAADLAKGTPVIVDGKRVGTTFSSGTLPVHGPDEERYLARTNQALLIGSLGGAVLAIILGLVLARTLAHPLSELTTAIESVTKGNLDQRVPVRTTDEIGKLAAAFNRMSGEMQRVNNLRRQMTADIAHDLRTPLTVISGYIESLRDGRISPTPKRYDILYQEVQHLQRLVEDLRTLSLADAGELQLQLTSCDPRTLLERVAAAFQNRADAQGVALVVRTDNASHSHSVRLDVERMAEVLGNLVSNSLRYTSGGEIVLEASYQTTGLTLRVIDTGSGIAAEALPNIFDRFYRADAARETREGESGLGLAIARSIVEAHGGHISAASELNHGTAITITLP